MAQTASETAWFKELCDYFAPVREEIIARELSGEEINADIDAAVKAVRFSTPRRSGPCSPTWRASQGRNSDPGC